jgi:uncharacterized RmlC-like cupin family protein
MAPISGAPAANPSCRLVRAGEAFQGKQGSQMLATPSSGLPPSQLVACNS